MQLKEQERGKPPSEGARLRMFISATDDYEEMSAVFPLPTAVTVGFARGDPAIYWPQIFHSAVLRKFFHGDDHLNLGRVYDAMEACAPNLNHDARQGLDHARLECAQQNARSIFAYVSDNAGERTDGEVAIDELYGRHLHGDYDRWQRSESGAAFGSSAAMHWNLSASRLLRSTRSILDGGLLDGSFDLAFA